MNDSLLNASISFIREHAPVSPRIALILGSGLCDFSDNLPNRTSIPTSDIPHYPVSTVEGHKGKLVFAMLNEKPLLAFQGRVHFYETRDLEKVLYPIHVAHKLGIRTLITTNAAGGINRTFLPGDLMIIMDQINFTFERRASTKPSLRQIYSADLIAKAEAAARMSGIQVKRGVYVGLKGPSYETASEIEMLTRIGGDAVGMSTVFESSVASSLGMDVLGISCITNLATGISPTKLSHQEVTEVGSRVKQTFATLVASTISLL